MLLAVHLIILEDGTNPKSTSRGAPRCHAKIKEISRYVDTNKKYKKTSLYDVLKTVFVYVPKAILYIITRNNRRTRSSFNLIGQRWPVWPCGPTHHVARMDDLMISSLLFLIFCIHLSVVDKA